MKPIHTMVTRFLVTAALNISDLVALLLTLVETTDALSYRYLPGLLSLVPILCFYLSHTGYSFFEHSFAGRPSFLPSLIVPSSPLWPLLPLFSSGSFPGSSIS